jgi:hypothetical protein
MIDFLFGFYLETFYAVHKSETFYHEKVVPDVNLDLVFFGNMDLK